MSQDAESIDSTSSILSSCRAEGNPIFVKWYLELLSSAVLASIDGSDGDTTYKALRKYCTSDVEMEYFPNEFPWPEPKSQSLKALIARATELKQRNPTWRFGAYNFSTTLDWEMENAVVWFTSSPSRGPISACEEGMDRWRLNRESVSQLRWRKRKGGRDEQGDWECWKHTVLRGGALGM